LYHVLLKSHYHVGSNAEEIQAQKEEHQAFQETAKVMYRPKKLPAKSRLNDILQVLFI